MTKPKKQPDVVWQKCVNAWFDFFQNATGKKPTFMGAAAGCFKKLYGLIKKSALDSGRVWDEHSAPENMTAFFTAAYNHQDARFRDRIRATFTIPELLFHFDKITVFNANTTPSKFEKFANSVREAASDISESDN